MAAVPVPLPDDPGEPIVLDGSNITRRSPGGFGDLLALEEELTYAGWSVLVVVDASLRHQLEPEDAEALEALLGEGWFQVPKGTDADMHILSEAQRLDAWVVSNDKFRNHMPPRRRLEPAALLEPADAMSFDGPPGRQAQ